MALTRRRFILATAASTVLPPLAYAQSGDNLGKLRAITASMPLRQWTNVPGTALRTVIPPKSMMPNEGAITGPSSVLSAWNGAAYDPARHQLYLWGGGHADYGGNEVYDLDLEQLKISRLTDPSPLTTSPPAGQDQKCMVPADSPSSAHDYDGIAWCPLTNSFWLWPYGGYCLSGGINPTGDCWEFIPTSKTWVRRPRAPIVGFFTVSWIPDHKKFFVQAGARTCWFDPIAKIYSDRSSQGADYGPCVSCYVTHRDEVWLGWAGMLKARLTEPVPGPLEPVIDPKNMPDPGTGGMTYDALNKMILIWGGSEVVRALNPDTLEWRQFSPAAGAPAPTKVHPVYSKWRYIAEVACCVAYNDIDEGLWLWKPGDLAQVPIRKEIPSFVVQNADGSNARSFLHAAEAAQNVKDGQTIRILKNPNGATKGALAIRANRVRIIGDPGAQIEGAVVDGVGLIAGYGDDLIVENLEIYNVHGDGSASGIRFNGKNFTGRNLKIHDCDMGFLSAGDNGVITFENVVISDCHTDQGLAHNVYVSENSQGTAAHFIFRRSQSLRAHDKGHLLKSRALATTIEDSLLAMQDANSSRCLDISDGGVVVIRNNVIQQGPKSDNEDIIGIALELPTDKLPPTQTRQHSTVVEGNIVISDEVSATIGLIHTRSPTVARVANNEIVIAPTQVLFGLAYPDYARQRGTVSDEGGNKVIRGRSAAGYQPLPWLPPITSL